MSFNTTANDFSTTVAQNTTEQVWIQHVSGAANDRDGFPSNGAMAFATTHGATTTTSAAGAHDPVRVADVPVPEGDLQHSFLTTSSTPSKRTS